VHDWLKAQLLPQRPQFWLSFRNMIESTHLPWHHSWPAEQLAWPIPGGFAGGGLGGGSGVTQASRKHVKRDRPASARLEKQPCRSREGMPHYRPSAPKPLLPRQALNQFTVKRVVRNQLFATSQLKISEIKTGGDGTSDKCPRRPVGNM
jgi:hypothetical protein